MQVRGLDIATKNCSFHFDRSLERVSQCSEALTSPAWNVLGRGNVVHDMFAAFFVHPSIAPSLAKDEGRVGERVANVQRNEGLSLLDCLRQTGNPVDFDVFERASEQKDELVRMASQLESALRRVADAFEDSCMDESSSEDVAACVDVTEAQARLSVQECLADFMARKTRLSSLVHTRLRAISGAQIGMQQCFREHHYTELAKRTAHLRRTVKALQALARMPRALLAASQELCRRRLFDEQLARAVEKVRARFDASQREEHARRKQFRIYHRPYLPDWPSLRVLHSRKNASEDSGVGGSEHVLVTAEDASRAMADMMPALMQSQDWDEQGVEDLKALARQVEMADVSDGLLNSVGDSPGTNDKQLRALEDVLLALHAERGRTDNATAHAEDETLRASCDQADPSTATQATNRPVVDTDGMETLAEENAQLKAAVAQSQRAIQDADARAQADAVAAKRESERALNVLLARVDVLEKQLQNESTQRIAERERIQELEHALDAAQARERVEPTETDNMEAGDSAGADDDSDRGQQQSSGMCESVSPATNVPRDDEAYARLLISWRTFHKDGLVLFVPWRKNKQHFVAFNHKAPYHFLNPACLSQFRAGSLLLGRITDTDTHMSSMENNPFGLPFGTSFTILTCTPAIDNDNGRSASSPALSASE